MGEFCRADFGREQTKNVSIKRASNYKKKLFGPFYCRRRLITSRRRKKTHLTKIDS